MGVSSPLRVFLMVLSSLAAAIALGVILFSLFSADYRYVDIAEVHGTRRFGLFRYCFTPKDPSSQTDQASCFLRTRQTSDQSPDVIRHFADFEFTTLILLGTSCALASLALFASICSLVAQTFVLAHSGLLLLSSMCALSGFSFYAYNNELKENQRETTGGVVYTYHFGWAFIYTGIGAGTLFAAFMCALVAAALTLRERRRKNKSGGLPINHHNNNTTSTVSEIMATSTYI